MPLVRVAISACLLGEKVRYEGNDKRDDALVESLGRHFEWVPVCPEVEMGLGVPREPIELRTGSDGEVRLIAVETGVDLTGRMKEYAAKKVRELEALGIAGCVFKSRSPSCGLTASPRGMFAQAITDAFPGMPVAEESSLGNPEARDEFLDRVKAYAYARRK